MPVLVKFSSIIIKIKYRPMAHFYVVRTKSDKTGPIEKKLFYGVPVTTGRVTTEELAEEIGTLF